MELKLQNSLNLGQDQSQVLGMECGVVMEALGTPGKSCRPK